MNEKDSIKILREKIIPNNTGDERDKDALNMAVSSLQTIMKIKDLIFKYRFSAVSMRNQKTYFTEHDVGYCEGALQVFEEVEQDIEGILRENKML